MSAAAACVFPAAIITEQIVDSFALESAFLIESARRFPAVAPLTMLAVMPSRPVDAPRAAFPAALLEAGQTGVDALGRVVRFVDCHLEDKFEPIVVGHEK